METKGKSIDFIDGKGIRFSYAPDEPNAELSLADVDISIRQGEFVALLGRNGSGKSTLVKHFNLLLTPLQGELTIAGLNARCEANIWRIRRHCGMVFQNPDNQFVSSIVNEDIAFGLENYGVPREEIPGRIQDALKLVGLDGFELRSVHMLSGGEKQRIALAGVLAVNPDILIFDEATSMLDPEGREEILSVITRLNQERHKTIVMISHYVEETILADRIYLIQNGKILANGSPREILTNEHILTQTGMIPPLPVRIYNDLAKNGFRSERIPLTADELAEEICRFI